MPRPIDTLNPGDRLPNGSILLAKRERSDRRPNDLVVLALHSGAGAPHPFATWRCNAEGNATLWGAYFDDLRSAVMDFETR